MTNNIKLLIIVIIGAAIGFCADKLFDTEPWMTIAGAIIFFVGYGLISEEGPENYK